MKCTYTELQKVLVFQNHSVRIEWVASSKLYASVAATQVRTTSPESDARDGRGDWRPIGVIKPFSEELWNACQRWLLRKASFAVKSDKELAELKNGKIPVEQKSWQES